MQSWRRIFALIMVLVFAPASVFAAVPRQLCLGSDGHQTVESIFDAQHHFNSSGHVFSKADANQAHGQFEEIADSKCVDIDLAVVSQRAPRALEKIAVIEKNPDVTPIQLLQTLGLVGVAECADGPHWPFQQGRVAMRDPVLSSLATVVLLN